MDTTLSLYCFLSRTDGFNASTFADLEALEAEVQADYEQRLGALFEHFHANPELSFVEFKTAARMAMKCKHWVRGDFWHWWNGRNRCFGKRSWSPRYDASRHGWPASKGRDGLPYASRVMQETVEGDLMPVMHACGHDVHITALIGTARYMANHRDEWSGTLMLLAQPAEEWKTSGAKAMKDDGVWEIHGTPDYALAFHVSADIEAGKLYASEGAAYSAVDSIDIEVPGIGARCQSPSRY